MTTLLLLILLMAYFLFGMPAVLLGGMIVGFLAFVAF
jgi:hypothetical protein